MSASAPTTSLASPVDLADVRRRLWELTCNVALAALFLRFALLHGQSAYQTLRLSSFVLLAKVSIDVWFFLTRNLPKGVSISVYDWVIGIAGTFAIVLFQPVAEATDLWVGHALQWSGMILQILGILSLNRSFGIVAANRGVKTQGMYRFIRHPLYFSYTVSFLGYVVNHPSSWNALIYAGAVLLWVLRLLAEERFLMQDPAYRDYAGQVRSRLIPGLF